VHAVQFHPEKSGGKLFITSTFLFLQHMDC
jgi:imidazoleglycerol phosphate synthase glutamine amidotransferase subunit HisH